VFYPSIDTFISFCACLFLEHKRKRKYGRGAAELFIELSTEFGTEFVGNRVMTVSSDTTGKNQVF
jgi:hypothetical protein